MARRNRFYYALSNETDREAELDRQMPDRRKETKEWRQIFFDQDLAKGESLFRTGCVNKEESWYDYDAKVRDGKVSFTASIQRHPTSLSETWESIWMHCTCARGRKGERCAHLAAAMFAYEKEHGPFVARETREEYQARKRKEAKEAEIERQTQLQKKLGMERVSPIDFIAFKPDEDRLIFFDLEAALREYVTTPYYIARAKELLENYRASDPVLRVQKTREGYKYLPFSFTFVTDLYTAYATGTISGSSILDLSSRIRWNDRSWYFDDEEDKLSVDPDMLDEYELAALKLLAKELQKVRETDQTDRAARTFFKELEKADRPVHKKEEELSPLKDRQLLLYPRITIEDGKAVLGFKMGRVGGRLFVLRNLRDFASHYQRGKEFALTKKESINFGSEDFIDDAVPLVQFVIRRVGEIGAVNEKIAERNYRYMRTNAISLGAMMELEGSVLDHFYDAVQGGECEYQDKTNAVQESTIPVGHREMRFQLRAERLADARGRFAGVAVSGLIPVMLRGSTGHYILNADGLSRITRSEEELLRPFRKVADASGYFRFCVGTDNLQEFYYRILPRLAANPCVDLDDECAEEARDYLPPEPEFAFYLDMEDDVLSCRCEVSYDEKKYIIKPGEERSKDYRDLLQEERIRKAVLSELPEFDESTGRFVRTVDDDSLYQFLTEGLAALEAYGTVHGSQAFRSQNVRSTPQLRMGISVDSDLMDLSVTSQDLSIQDLLEVMESYKQRKKYHRLRSGDFIDLQDTGGLREMETLLADMDVSLTEAIEKGVSLPLYRALYLDKKLEEHEQIAARRDRTYRALIRNFRSVRDAEYEAPADVEDTLRPYQSDGFKWLKTVEAAGFGGILADEMGLGKTLQMIAVLLADKEAGVKKTSLVVCPASLVFNWQEEIRRFAPSLSCEVMSGGLPARKKILKNLSDVDVLVTSYGTLKRDITLYADIAFHICVLDEAQFIKNAKAAVSKAVRVVKSDHRFALTGTPIENRLSELWSIFDFLMPGFLYNSPEFTRRFELPILKTKDKGAAERLKRMTSPFILRRCKQEVLTDLPDKLEEVRYARLSGEQQKLYDAQVLRMKGMLSDGYESGEDKIRIFAELMRIRQICCDPSLLFEDYQAESAKRDACLELIHSAIDGGHRMLVFSQFTSMLALLEEDLKREEIPYYVITGATPKQRRLQLVNAFNEGDVPVFLISLKAGGTGLNLTGADVVIHYDPWWNLAAQNQATDRAHRIGQTRQVTVYRLILKDTIEERILQLQNMKKDLADAILEGEGESLMRMSGEELLALLD